MLLRKYFVSVSNKKDVRILVWIEQNEFDRNEFEMKLFRKMSSL